MNDAFSHDRFAELTDLAQRYRVGKSRTGSGLWKLTLLYAGIDQAIYRERGVRDPGPKYLAVDDKIKRWTRLQPKSPAAHLAYAQVLIKRAWAIRGSGYVSTVPPEAWAPFHALIEAARAYLETTKAVAAVDPHWYELMLDIGRVQSWDEKKFGATFDAAIAQEPLFYQTYFAAVDYFLPKWRGSVNDLELFAQLAVTETAATEGTGMYARIYWYASQSEFRDALFEDSLANWPKMKAGFDDILARYPDDWNYNTYGKFACLAGDQKASSAFFVKIGDQPLDAAWTTPGLLEACRNWAMSGAL